MAESDVLRRVRALLDKAGSTEFEAERDALVSKAQELMVRHAIDEGLLKAKDGGGKPEVREVTYTQSAAYKQSKRDLLGAIVRANRCRVVYIDSGRRGGPQLAEIVGYPDDLSWVEMLYTSLLVQMTAAGQVAHREHVAHVQAALARLVRDPEGGWLDPGATDENDWYDRRPTIEHGRTFFASFADGFIYAVRDRLQEAERRARAAADAAAPAGQPGSDLVLRDRKREVDDYYKEQNPPETLSKFHSSGSGASSDQGWASGALAGRTADLTGGNRGIGNRPALTRGDGR